MADETLCNTIALLKELENFWISLVVVDYLLMRSNLNKNEGRKKLRISEITQV